MSQNSGQPWRTAGAWPSVDSSDKHRNFRRQALQSGDQHIVRRAVGTRDRRVVGFVFDVVARRVHLEDGPACDGHDGADLGEQQIQIAARRNVQGGSPVG